MELGFIHITKTGGTNLKDKNKNPNIHYEFYHFEDALHYKNKQMKCYAIIRCPVERYISLFYYNTRGSDKNTIEHLFNYNTCYSLYYSSLSPNNISIKDYVYENINEFVDLHYNNRNFINRYEDGLQFKKQVDWLQNGDKENTFLVLYDKKELINNVAKMCDSLGFKFIYNNNNENINNTKYQNMYELTEESKRKIIEMYKDDYILYEKIKMLNKPFCKLSEIN